MAAGCGDVGRINAWVDFEDDDVWVIKPGDARRQYTDSVLERSGRRSTGFDLGWGAVAADNAPTGWQQLASPGNSCSLTAPEVHGQWPPRRQRTPDEPEPIPGDAASASSRYSDPLFEEALDARRGAPWPEAAQPYAAARAAATAAVDPRQELQGKTTVMLRPIPCKVTQRKLMRDINNAGFLGRYDFIYLPMDQRARVNRGFAFCNLESPEMAMRFHEVFHGKTLGSISCDKGKGPVEEKGIADDASEDLPLEVVAADIQGFERNAEQYLCAYAKKGSRYAQSRPLLLRELPPHLANHLGAFFLDQQIGQSLPNAAASSHQQKNAIAVMGPYHTATRAGGEPHHSSSGRGAPPAPTPAPALGAAAPQAPGRTATQPRFCPYCGAPKEAQFIFCPFCGQKTPDALSPPQMTLGGRMS